jgi:hypothetical protein
MAGQELIKRMDGVMDGAMRRVELIRREDGLFQFFERHWEAPEFGARFAASWGNLHRSGLYETQDEGEREARKFLAMKRPNPLRD